MVLGIGKDARAGAGAGTGDCVEVGAGGEDGAGRAVERGGAGGAEEAGGGAGAAVGAPVNEEVAAVEGGG